VIIYCLSGLGADERAFVYLELPGHELRHVQWITPLPNESLESYATRLIPQLDQTEPFVLLGLSFGGMLAVEMQKQLHPVQTILLSSIAHVTEKPARMHLMKRLNAYAWIPSKYFVRPSAMAFNLFGAHTERERRLLTEILADSDPSYMRWALKAIAHWKNTQHINHIRIHGDADKLFPIRGFDPDFVIQGGGHLMVVSHAKQVSDAILMALK